MTNEQRVTFRLPPDMADKLKRLSDQRGVSTAQLIRSVLERYLGRMY